MSVRTNMERTESYQSDATIIRRQTDSNPPPTKEELKSWCAYMRDILTSRVLTSHDTALDSDVLSEAEEFLELLKRASIDVETLRYSRVHNALEQICATGSKWPLSIVMTAEQLLSQWDSDLGSLKDIRGNLWGIGGKLEGIIKVTDWTAECKNEIGDTTLALVDTNITLVDQDVVKTKKQHSAWSVETRKGPRYPLQAGHIGFRVGEVAAYRDGIIHGLPFGITADENGGYAVLMTEDQEVESQDFGNIKYRTSNKDPGCFKLMKNLVSKQLVRILRSYRLVSTWSPKAGIRYEGLYQVEGWAVKLTTTATGDDDWQYTFTFSRYPDQAEAERALCHPTADELDDFNDYKKMKADWKDAAPTTESHEKRQIIDWILDSTLDSSDKKGSVDSGYFTVGATRFL